LVSCQRRVRLTFLVYDLRNESLPLRVGNRRTLEQGRRAHHRVPDKNQTAPSIVLVNEGADSLIRLTNSSCGRDADYPYWPIRLPGQIIYRPAPIPQDGVLEYFCSVSKHTPDSLGRVLKSRMGNVYAALNVVLKG